MVPISSTIMSLKGTEGESRFFHVENTSRGQIPTAPAQPLSYLFSIFENPKPQLQLKISTSTQKIKSHFPLRRDAQEDMWRRRAALAHTPDPERDVPVEPFGHQEAGPGGSLRGNSARAAGWVCPTNPLQQELWVRQQ